MTAWVTSASGASQTSVNLFYYGSLAAWSLINDGTLGILKNFHISYFSFDCAVYGNFDAKTLTNCFIKDIDKFGLAHISAPIYSMATAEMTIFKKLNLTLPVVGALPASYLLNSTALYPMFTRVVISNRYMLTLTSLLLKALGWNQLCVLYPNDTGGISGYSALMENAKQYGLEVLNPESLRTISGDINRTSIKEYADSLQAIIDTDARLLVLLWNPSGLYYIIEELYDMGMRKGDLVIFSQASEYLTMLQYDYMYTYKIKEIAVPMLAITGQNWVGKAGKFAYSKISSLYKVVPSSYACLYYDAAYFISSALDYTINQGLDYLDPYQLNLTLRAHKIAGCTGLVSIEKNSNDRVIDVFDIMASKINMTSGNVMSYKVGEFHPYSSIMLAINEPIVYGDGTTVKPDDLRNQNNECPFPQKLVRTFTRGRILAFGICAGFALLSLASTVYIWKRWWNISIEELKTRHEISLEDLIVYLTVAIEFFQFVAMGPDVTPIMDFLAKISDSFSLNLENILKLKNGVFWLALDAVYGAIILWAVLCFIILLRLDEKFPGISILRLLAWGAEYLMPVLGNLCFIPFVSMCLNVFICDQSIGESFTDSFLSQDCYYFCWKGQHLVYAVFSFIALICYEPFAVFCRPLWQELISSLHIQTSPRFLMVKTVVQIVFILLNKTVKRSQRTVHGAIFAVIMAAYIGFMFKNKPYNYPRLCWWQCLSLIGVLWLSLLSTISSLAGENSLIYLILVCSGWVVIVAVGFYVQKKKYPSLLYRKKGLDTTNLFKFAFGFGKHSKKALSKIAPNRSSESSIRSFNF